MEKCPIHDEAMKGLREDIHEVRAVVNRIEKMLHGNGEGLTVQAAKNTDFRLKAEKKEADEARNWKRIMPSVIGGIITALIVGLLLVLFPLMAKGEDYQNIHKQIQVKQAQIDLLNKEIKAINIDSLFSILTYTIKIKQPNIIPGEVCINPGWQELEIVISHKGELIISIYECQDFYGVFGYGNTYRTKKAKITIPINEFDNLYKWLISKEVINGK